MKNLVLFALVLGTALCLSATVRAQDRTQEMPPPSQPGLLQTLGTLGKPAHTGLRYINVSAMETPVEKEKNDAPEKTETKTETKTVTDQKPGEKTDRLGALKKSLPALKNAESMNHIVTAAGRKAEAEATTSRAENSAEPPAPRKGPDDSTRLFKNVSDYNR